MAGLSTSVANEGIKSRRRVSRLRYAISIVVLALCGLVYAGFATQSLVSYEVISGSMAPTLLKGDRVLVHQWRGYQPVVDDLVALVDPEDERDFLLTKRVAAVEGQTVEIAGGYLYVDGEKWAVPGRQPMPVPPDRHLAPLTIGRGEVFVLGDNVENSEDSLAFGPVKADTVKGKVLFIYWPPSRMGKVR